LAKIDVRHNNQCNNDVLYRGDTDVVVYDHQNQELTTRELYETARCSCSSKEISNADTKLNVLKVKKTKLIFLLQTWTRNWRFKANETQIR
jgi:hypothetical protein